MGQSTSPPSKDRTCCCSCLWLPLPSRHPRPSGTPTWCRMCTTSTPSSMPSTESTRNIWPLSLSNVKDSKAVFETSTSTCGGTGTTAGTAACTVSGEVIFSQNGLKDVLCGNNGGLTINLQGTGMKTGNKYKLFIDTATT